MSWRIEVSLPTRELNWSLLRIAGFDTEYHECDRKRAALATAKLSHLFSGKLVFRMVHKNPRRGAFYPAPRQAKVAQ